MNYIFGKRRGFKDWDLKLDVMAINGFCFGMRYLKRGAIPNMRRACFVAICTDLYEKARHIEC